MVRMCMRNIFYIISIREPKIYLLQEYVAFLYLVLNPFFFFRRNSRHIFSLSYNGAYRSTTKFFFGILSDIFVFFREFCHFPKLKNFTKYIRGLRCCNNHYL